MTASSGFVWTELNTTDVTAATAFFADLFGWSCSETEMSGGRTYSMFMDQDGKLVGGVHAMPPEVPPGTPPVWFSYIGVADVDAVVARVPEAGGRVLKAPMEIPGYGRMAVIADPTGAAVGLWQSRAPGAAD